MMAAGYSYRYAPIAALEIPPAPEWLGQSECREHDRLRDAPRRRAWLAGRWLAKQLLAERLGLSLNSCGLAQLEIHSRNEAGQKVRPVATWSAEGLSWALSIAHTDRGVLVAVAPPGMSIGVDLVDQHETPGPGFDRAWFNRHERDWIGSQPQQRRLVLWAAKEAAYKALNRGEPFRPHNLHIDPRPDHGFDCTWHRHASDTTCRLTTWQTPLDELAVLAVPGTPQRAFPTAPLMTVH